MPFPPSSTSQPLETENRRSSPSSTLTFDLASTESWDFPQFIEANCSGLILSCKQALSETSAEAEYALKAYLYDQMTRFKEKKGFELIPSWVPTHCGFRALKSITMTVPLSILDQSRFDLYCICCLRKMWFDKVTYLLREQDQSSVRHFFRNVENFLQNTNATVETTTSSYMTSRPYLKGICRVFYQLAEQALFPFGGDFPLTTALRASCHYQNRRD